MTTTTIKITDTFQAPGLIQGMGEVAIGTIIEDASFQSRYDETNGRIDWATVNMDNGWIIRIPSTHYVLIDPREIPMSDEAKREAMTGYFNVAPVLAQGEAVTEAQATSTLIAKIAEQAATQAKEKAAYKTVAARANSGSKVHAMYARNRVLFCRSNVGDMGWALNNTDIDAVDCKNCITHLEAGW